MAKRSKVGNPKLAVAYVRVSTDDQRQELGLEAQRRAIATWAAREGVQIVATFEESVSGGAPLEKRPVLLEAIAIVATTGAGALVVAKVDRFSRDNGSAALAEAELRRHGASLRAPMATAPVMIPPGSFVRGILLAVARFEKVMIRARIVAALAVKKSRGELTGAAPYGKRVGPDGKTLELHPEEAATLERIRALRASGLTVRATLQAATAEGLRGRTGRPFTLAAVHAMIAA